jgi:hypothetical protein
MWWRLDKESNAARRYELIQVDTQNENKPIAETNAVAFNEVKTRRLCFINIFFMGALYNGGSRFENRSWTPLR